MGFWPERVESNLPALDFTLPYAKKYVGSETTKDREWVEKLSQRFGGLRHETDEISLEATPELGSFCISDLSKGELFHFSISTS